MKYEILEFINSFKLQPTGNMTMGYNFNITTSKFEIKSKTQKSFKVSNLKEAVQIISEIPNLKSKIDTETILINDLKLKIIDSGQGFYVVIDVKLGQPFP
jgi:hypothetical protein